MFFNVKKKGLEDVLRIMHKDVVVVVVLIFFCVRCRSLYYSVVFKRPNDDDVIGQRGIERVEANQG